MGVCNTVEYWMECISVNIYCINILVTDVYFFLDIENISLGLIPLTCGIIEVYKLRQIMTANYVFCFNDK